MYVSSQNDAITTMFTDYNTSQNMTVPANGTKNVSILASSAPTGTRFFVPFFIAPGNGDIVIQQFSIDGGGMFSATFRNVTAQSITTTVNIRIRCIKVLN